MNNLNATVFASLLIIILMVNTGCLNSTEKVQKKNNSAFQDDNSSLMIRYIVSDFHCPDNFCVKIDIFLNGEVIIFDGNTKKNITKNISQENVDLLKTTMKNTSIFEECAAPELHKNPSGNTTFYFSDGKGQNILKSYNFDCLPDSAKEVMFSLW